MKKSLHMIAVLTALGVLAGITLSYTASTTEDRIKKNIENATADAVRKLFPDAEKVVKEESGTGEDAFGYHRAMDPAGATLGYAFTGVGSGYQDKIFVMIGIDAELAKVAGITVLQPCLETPGLGGKIRDDKWAGQFAGMDAAVSPALKKAGGKVDAITGATISSRAVVKIVGDTLATARQAIPSAGKSEENGG